MLHNTYYYYYYYYYTSLTLLHTPHSSMETETSKNQVLVM